MPRNVDDHVEAQVETRCTALGLDSPPSLCHLRLMALGPRWIVYLWNPEGHAPTMAAWLREQGDFERLQHASARERVIVFETDRLPPLWERLTDLTADETMIIRADGSARIPLAGPRELVAEIFWALSEDAETDLASIRLTDEPGSESKLLSDEQQKMIQTAYEAGYFDVPRRIQLSDLAEKVSKSQGALSEMLRRAQRHIVGSYLDDQEEREGEEPDQPVERADEPRR